MYDLSSTHIQYCSLLMPEKDLSKPLRHIALLTHWFIYFIESILLHFFKPKKDLLILKFCFICSCNLEHFSHVPTGF